MSKGTGAGAWSWQADIDPRESTRLANEFRDKQRQIHKERLAEKKAAREDEKRRLLEAGGAIGPPNPHAYRKTFRPKMTP